MPVEWHSCKSLHTAPAPHPSPKALIQTKDGQIEFRVCPQNDQPAGAGRRGGTTARHWDETGVRDESSGDVGLGRWRLLRGFTAGLLWINRVATCKLASSLPVT